jgi:uncharacterized membrane protein
MRNQQTYDIALIAVFTALIAVFALVPFLGFIQIGIIALTTIHIPVLIGGIIGGRRVSLSLGIVFGIMSFTIAWLRPSAPVDFLFRNPLISVLPRVIFGYALYEVYVLFNKLISNRYVATIISMMVSTFIHTILVLTSLWLFGGQAGIFGAILPFFWAVLVANGFSEMVAAGLIGGPIAERVRESRDIG